MKKSRFLLCFVVCLVLPLAAAKAVLSFGWFSDKTNNKGQWLTEELLLLPAVAEKQHWRLAYLTADLNCDMRCEEAAYLQQQVYQAMASDDMQQLQQQMAAAMMRGDMAEYARLVAEIQKKAMGL